MDDAPYSALKILHHPERLDILRAGGQPVPTQLQISISDTCNHDCWFCSYRMSGFSSNEQFSVPGLRNPKRMIPLEKVLEILDDCRAMGIPAVHLTGGGEPTVHPKHIDVFDAVLERDLQLALDTNGTRLGDQSIERLLEAAWVRFSLDAGTSESYAKIRRVPADLFTRTLANIARFVERRDSTGAKVRIGVNYVVTTDNYQEITQAAKLCVDIGVDYFRITTFVQNAGSAYYDAILGDVREQIASARVYSPRVYNHFDARLESLLRPDYSFCGYQHFQAFIGADLGVYRCCDTAYSGAGLLGSLAEQSLRSLWQSHEKQTASADFDARRCKFCRFNAQNRAIAYAVDPDPPDVNFV